VPKRKRVQREHTENWQTIQQYTLWPEQTAHELLRPVVLFGDPTTKRQERRVSHVPAWSAKLTLSMSRAWSASSLPGHANSHRKRRGKSRRGNRRSSNFLCPLKMMEPILSLLLVHLRDLLSIGFEILAFELSYNSSGMKIRDQGDIDV